MSNKGPTDSDATEKPLQFRKDIAGLRGFAVLLVVFAHFKIPGFDSGFVGVDIFFVISGFLITKLMAREYELNSEGANGWGWISLSNFYLRRIRRIFPAAITVITVTVLFSTFQLNSVRVSQIQNDALWAAASLANINFMHQSTNYFFEGLATSPLLHYWSLGVEEQFYLIWPLIFLGAVSFHGIKIMGRKYSWKERLINVSLVVSLVSFLLMIIGFKVSPNSVYFSPLARAWELGLGAFFGLLSSPSNSDESSKRILRFFRMISMFGLGLSLIFVKDTNFGFTLILPVLSSGYLIWSNQDVQINDIPTRIFNTKILSYIGKISFSLYLWHWPISIFGNETGWINSLSDRIFAILISLFLAVVTFSQVEQRFQRIPISAGGRRKLKRIDLPSPISRSKNVMAASVAILALILITYPSIFSTNLNFSLSKKPDFWTPPAQSSQVLSADKLALVPKNSALGTFEVPAEWKSKLSSSINLATIPESMKPSLDQLLSDKSPIFYQCLTGLIDAEPPCIFGSTLDSAKVVIILGDSFAISLYGAISGALSESDWKIIYLTRGQCMVADVVPMTNGKPDADCVKHRNWTQEYVKKVKPDLLILHSASSRDIDGTFQDFSEGLESAMETLTHNSKTTVTIGLMPESGNLSECTTKNLEITKCYTSIRSTTSYRFEEQRLSKKYGAYYIDPTSWLCYLGRCPPIIDNTPVYWDGGHLSATMSTKLAPLLKGALAVIGVK